ncbi:hypothetical protein DL98DRAFT_508789 [Cadophora sp. DSE1049]|nr:hypothetical protein DL98DRAFT_508789 [Cadophora sp. DSE1049]
MKFTTASTILALASSTLAADGIFAITGTGQVNRPTHPRNPPSPQRRRRRRSKVLRHSRNFTPPSLRQHPLRRRLRPDIPVAQHPRGHRGDVHQPHEYVYL